MSKFKVANGYVRITDEEVKIEQNATEGLARYYRERKKFIVILSLSWAAYLGILFATDIVGNGIRFIFVFVTLLIPGVILAEKVAEALDRQPINTLQKSSIERVGHKKFDLLNLGKMSIKYSEDGEDNLRNVWVSFLSKTNGGHIDDAMATIESEDIPTDREKPPKEDQSTNSVAKRNRQDSREDK